MNTTPHGRLADALSAADSSVRLRAALSAGTEPDPGLLEILIARCGVEPDFFIRDMLTWALCRLPADITVPRLIEELDSAIAQARSQALHTLSKIGDPRAWPPVSARVHDEDDEVARSAWRAAVALVPVGEELALATALVPELGRGDRDRQLSLSRAFAGLGEVVLSVLDAVDTHPDPLVRAHAEATGQLVRDPESSFTLSVEVAERVVIAGPDH